MYFSNHPEQFRSIILNEISFVPEQRKHYVSYQNPGNPEAGLYHHYERRGFYTFGIGEYTIEKSFGIQFDNKEPLLRMGIVYDGVTRFQLEDRPVSSSRPSPFFVIEENIRGRQVWKAGQHFRGVEIAVQPEFIEEISGRFPGFSLSEYFIKNHTYHYLPEDIIPVFQRMMYLDRKDCLDSVSLEGCLLECLGILKEYGKLDVHSVFTGSVDYGRIDIGKKHRVSFSASDFQSIQKAHKILTENFVNPPTIDMLSREILLNPQKLKAGFLYYYHMTIGEYVTSLKMSTAAELLCTTEKPVAEIAEAVGYGYASNFIKKFLNTYGYTPLKYRMNEKHLNS